MKNLLAVCFQLIVLMNLSAQPTANYEESRVPPYILPDVLTLSNGKKVTTPTVWVNKRRPEVMALFEKYVYGKLPGKAQQISFDKVYSDATALSGKATRKEIAIAVENNGKRHSFRLLIYLPNSAKGRVPVFVGLNFFGNHSISTDPGIGITKSWMPNPVDLGVNDSTLVSDHNATEKSRGMSADSWPLEMIIGQGFGVATIYYGDLMPDHPEGFKEGVYPLFQKGNKVTSLDSLSSAISTWAWGLSRAMDYFERDSMIDPKKIIVLGHSRLGKTALWAGAQDTRFAMVISNNSGCGGAALSKRIFGETVGTINRSFPHWFCQRFKTFNEKEEKLPLDQHMLIALCAPRPVYIASAESDPWADPQGEFLSAKFANPVYRLLGTDGLKVTGMPLVNAPSLGSIGYHIRTGEHGLTAYDWEQYLNFANVHINNQK